MPELPDIEMYLSALRERVLGEPLERIRVTSPFIVRSYDPPIAALQGHCVVGLRRIGKRIVFALEQELFLVVHLMIAGRFKEKKRGAAVPRRVGLLALDFPKLTLVLTEVSKKKRASVQGVKGEAALAEHDPGGIDVLGCSLKQFRAALTRENHTLKRTMTDPRVFSGVGNGYSDEILHHAQISPLKWTTRLTADETARLHKSTKLVLKEWTKRLNDERQGAWPEKVTAFRPEMAVHGKHKQPCPRCQAPVQRIVRGASEVNYCAPCQTGGKLLADRALSRLLKRDWPKALEAREAHMERLRQAGVEDDPAESNAGEATPSASTSQKPKLPASLLRPNARPRVNAKPKLPASLQRPKARAPVAADSATKSSPKKPARSRSKRKPKPLLLLAHGAGASSSSEWMKGWARRLSTLGKVVAFDYAYMAAGRKLPDKHDKLVEAHAAALTAARKKHRGRVVLLGKSMGGRIGCHLSLLRPVAGLVCLGYPLVSQGKKRRVRDEVLLQLSTPVLFVQGTRDKLCPLEQLDAVRGKMTAASQLHVVDTGDHSLLATKTWCKQTGSSQADADAQVLLAIERFLATL